MFTDSKARLMCYSGVWRDLGDASPRSAAALYIEASTPPARLKQARQSNACANISFPHSGQWASRLSALRGSVTTIPGNLCGLSQRHQHHQDAPGNFFVEKSKGPQICYPALRSQLGICDVVLRASFSTCAIRSEMNFLQALHRLFLSGHFTPSRQASQRYP
jgi:hypothetical protein